MKILFTPSYQVEKLKQQARKLKRESGLSHHEALDQVAKNCHYHHWKHVTEMAAITEPSEIAYRSGLLVAFDVKEADSVDDELFEPDKFAEFFCDEQLLQIYIEEDDDDFHDLPEQIKHQYFRDFLNELVFFRYIGEQTPNNIDEASKLIVDYCFWRHPEYIWIKGKHYNTHDIRAAYEKGN